MCIRDRARRARGRCHRRPVRRAARRHLLAPARQRHRGRHRADAVRHRPRLLPRQAADRAYRAAAAGDRFRLVERRAAGARGAEDQRAVPLRGRARAAAGLGARHDALGVDPAHRRRERRRRTRHGLFRRRHPHARHHARRLSRRHRRVFPVPLLSRQLERGALERAGHHRGSARDLRALESDGLLLGIAALRRRRRARAGAAVRRRQPGLLPLQRGALHPHLADHDHHLLSQAHASRRARGAEHHQVTRRSVHVRPLHQVRAVSVAL